MSILTELQALQQKIVNCRTAEEFFGEPDGKTQEEKLKWLKDEYLRVIKKCHPDKVPLVARDLAENISRIVNPWYAIAQNKIRSGTYNRPQDVVPPEFEDFVISVGDRNYQVTQHLAEGDWTDVYLAQHKDKQGMIEPVCLRVVQDEANNDLLQNVRRVLTVLNAELSKHTYNEAPWPVPTLLDSFQLEDGRFGLVTRYIEAFDLVTLREIFLENWRSNPNSFRDKLQNHLCWIMERLLAALGFVHSNGIIHASIQPANILIRPQDHSGYFLGFSLSFVDPAENDTIRGYTEHYTAPEAMDKTREKRPPIPEWDLYALGKCMIFLLGGDASENKISSNIAGRMDPGIIKFIGRMLREDPMRRANDAWKAYDELSDLREKILGARHEFLEFPVPREYTKN